MSAEKQKKFEGDIVRILEYTHVVQRGDGVNYIVNNTDGATPIALGGTIARRKIGRAYDILLVATIDGEVNTSHISEHTLDEILRVNNNPLCGKAKVLITLVTNLPIFIYPEILTEYKTINIINIDEAFCDNLGLEYTPKY